MGAAAIGVALWKYVMRYDPKSPELFNRDRFVLSNGAQNHENGVCELRLMRRSQVTLLCYSITLCISVVIQR